MDFEAQFLPFMISNHKDLIEDIRKQEKITPETEAKLKEVVGKFVTQFNSA